MIYKDLAQWFQRKTFAVHYILFFGVCQLIFTLGYVISLADDTAGPIGQGLAGILAATLVGIAYILSGQSFMLIRSEMQSRTMELFLLSGLSLERIILGRWVTVLFQFLLCGVVLVPFMLGSIFFGGVDPFSVVASIVLTIIIVLLLSMYAILAAVLTQNKHVKFLLALSTFGILLGLTIFCFITWGMFLADESGNAISGIAYLMRVSLEGDWVAISGLLFMGLVIVELLVFMFYMACHAIRPSSDTRARHIQLSALVILLTYLGVFLFSLIFNSYDDDDLIGYSTILFFILLAVGLVSLFGPEQRPMMDIARERRNGLLKRLVMAPTGHDVGGSSRFALLVLAICSLFSIGINMVGGVRTDDYSFAGVIMLVPWYLVFPGFLLRMNKKLAANHTALRVILVAWWVFSGIFFSIISAIFFRDSEPLNILAALITPAWGWFISMNNDIEVVFALQFLLGIFSCILILIYAARQTHLQGVKLREYVMNEPEKKVPETPEAEIVEEGVSAVVDPEASLD